MIAVADLQRVVERILAHHAPEAIYVFGSYAKDEQHAGSDLDLVIVERNELPRPLRGRDVRGLLTEMPFDIDMLFVTPDELERDMDDPWSLLGTVMPTARLVYAAAATRS